MGAAPITPGAGAHGLGASALLSAEEGGGWVQGSASSRLEAGWPVLVYGIKTGKANTRLSQGWPSPLEN